MGDVIHLSGIDLVDGTPILDVKPYVAEADRPLEFSGGWTDTVQPTCVACAFNPDALADLEMLVKGGRIRDRDQFVKLVEDVLRLDPRPLSYRARVNERFAIVLGGLDVHARFSENLFTVVAVQVLRDGPPSKADRSNP